MLQQPAHLQVHRQRPARPLQGEHVERPTIAGTRASGSILRVDLFWEWIYLDDISISFS